MKKIILIFVLILNLFLNIYGNTWGLPSRWHADEKVANVLHMAAGRTSLDQYDYFVHPTGYQLILLSYMIPYYIYLRLINYPLENVRQAASVSWDYMAGLFPDFATNIYIYARALSALLGVITVYLIFCLGTELYGESAGLFSAALLSVCMGFVEVNHLAKYISLVNLLITLAIFLCVLTIKKGNSKEQRKFFSLASFFVGFSISTQYNSFLLCAPLFIVFLILRMRARERLIMLSYALLFLALGFIIGTPSILTQAKGYLPAFFTGSLKSNFAATGLKQMPFRETLQNIFIGPLNYFFELWSINGIAIFIFILIGLFRALWFWEKLSKKEIVIFGFIFCYYFVMTILNKDKFPQVKYIIAIAPLLILYSGKSMSEMFQSKKIHITFKFVIFTAVFIYSFLYTLNGNQVFIKDDTRYYSTQWIMKNIPKGSKIEVFDQLLYVASSEIMRDYEIIYLGRSSKYFKGTRFFKWDTVKNRENYLEHINRYDSSSDYIIINMDSDDVDELGHSALEKSYLLGREQYIKALFENGKNFSIVKIIRFKNRKISSRKIKGLVYHENLLWDPIPCYDTTSDTIFIFKKNADNNKLRKLN